MNQTDCSASFQIFAVVEKHSHLHKTVFCKVEKCVDNTNKNFTGKRKKCTFHNTVETDVVHYYDLMHVII